MTSRILLLTGMTPDDRVYDRLLPRFSNAIVVPWITPQSNERISQYCDRLAATIDCDEPIILCGVSFGGIIAREQAPKINAMTCVLISSIRDLRELPPWFRCWRPFAGRYLICSTFTQYRWNGGNAFSATIRTAATARATKFAGGTSTWHQWATASVLAWSPQLPIAATAKKVGLATPGSLDSVFFQASGGTYGFSVIADCHNYSLQRRS